MRSRLLVLLALLLALTSGCASADIGSLDDTPDASSPPASDGGPGFEDLRESDRAARLVSRIDPQSVSIDEEGEEDGDDRRAIVQGAGGCPDGMVLVEGRYCPIV